MVVLAARVVLFALREGGAVIVLSFGDTNYQEEQVAREVTLSDRTVMLDFWAKSGRAEGPAMHSIAHHSLDVAAVAITIRPELRAPVAISAATLAALVAVHDIGKFTRTFQAKVEKLWPTALGPFKEAPAGYPHDAMGYLLLSNTLVANIDPLFAGWRSRARRSPVLRAITGHHGRPPPEPQSYNLPGSVACTVCLAAAAACVDAILEALKPPPVPRLEDGEQEAFAWWLAGLTTLADWIGSGRWFTPVAARAHADLGVYWQTIALPRAQRAVAESGVIASTVAPARGTQALFPEIVAPRPLQRWTETVPLPEGPTLFLMEDATGAGKTEAALVLSHRLMSNQRGHGLFFALPTMATANAMYDRLGDAYDRLFTPGSRPSLVLAHGRRMLKQGFTDSILAGAAETAPTVNNDPADETAGVQCASWIADDRRKSFLAEVGVGTIDQALLAVLPARHAMLRLLGLSQRILVVDEAHAYDAYMGEELKRLLQFHAALGGSAIVLSATLTGRQRRELAEAFCAGLNIQREAGELSSAYPLATVVSRDAITETHIPMTEALSRRVAVERVESPEAAADTLVAATKAGAAVAWVRNAVDDAIAAAELLRARGLDPLLFHARFAMGDRLDREHEVLRRFGKHADANTRQGQALVATQVVEQSVDLDFDLMVSDLAPVDLIIQRVGRVWRHGGRTRAVPEPRLMLLAPSPVDNPTEGWLGAELRRTGFVYRDHALLWRSARVLLEAGEIISPDNVRSLVEAAYDRTGPDAEPPGLEPATRRAWGEWLAARGVALQNLLKVEEPYCRESGLWEPDVRTPTRLGEPQITLRLARLENGRLVPWCPDPDGLRAWALSEVSVRAARVAGPAPDAVAGPLIEAVRKNWPRWDRETAVLVLRRGDGPWTAGVLDRQGRRVIVGYDLSLGLTFSPAGQE